MSRIANRALEILRSSRTPSDTTDAMEPLMDFTKSEILDQLLWLIASASRMGLLIADRVQPAISGLSVWGEGDEPKLQFQDFAFGEIH